MITSTSNQQVKRLRELLEKPRARAKSGLFVLEGLRMVREIPPEYLEALYLSASFAGICEETRRGFSAAGPDLVLPLDWPEPVVLEDRVFRSLSDTKNPQGILAVARQPHYETGQMYSRSSPLILFLENIQDPGNLGTMIRTAQGAGAAGVIMSRDTADIFSPKVTRSTMGSLFRMPFAYVDDICAEIRHARSSGISVYAAALGAGQSYTAADYRQGTAFVIGNEGNGMTDGAIQACTAAVEIPLHGGLESLNASAAAAILLFEAARQRSLPQS